MIYRQRRVLSVLRALGGSSRTVVGTTTIWALLLGLLGSALGVAVALPAAHVLNEVVAAVVGFEGLVRTPPRVVAGGAMLGAVVSAVAALVISALVTRTATPGETLR